MGSKYWVTCDPIVPKGLTNNGSLVCECVSRLVWSYLGDIFDTLLWVVLHLSLRYRFVVEL